jgi:hypothetical protein
MRAPGPVGGGAGVLPDLPALISVSPHRYQSAGGCPGLQIASQPSEKRRAAHTSLRRSSLNRATRLPNRHCDTVTALCRFTAHGPFMPSFSSSATSEGTPRIVDVTGATVTVDRYGMALSRVSTTTGLFLSGGANWYSRISPRAILSATQPRIPKEPTRRAPPAARNTPPDHVLPGTEWSIAGGVHGERPAPALNDCVLSGGPRGPLPATVSYRERPE